MIINYWSIVNLLWVTLVKGLFRCFTTQWGCVTGCRRFCTRKVSGPTLLALQKGGGGGQLVIQLCTFYMRNYHSVVGLLYDYEE